MDSQYRSQVNEPDPKTFSDDLLELDPGEEKRKEGGREKKRKKEEGERKRRRRERKKEERGGIMIELAKRSTLRIYGSHFITISIHF